MLYTWLQVRTPISLKVTVHMIDIPHCPNNTILNLQIFIMFPEDKSIFNFDCPDLICVTITILHRNKLFWANHHVVKTLDHRTFITCGHRQLIDFHLLVNPAVTYYDGAVIWRRCKQWIRFVVTHLSNGFLVMPANNIHMYSIYLMAEIKHYNLHKLLYIWFTFPPSNSFLSLNWFWFHWVNYTMIDLND